MNYTVTNEQKNIQMLIGTEKIRVETSVSSFTCEKKGSSWKKTIKRKIVYLLSS